MSRYVCKLLTDRGVRYVVFCNTSDQFVSPTFSTAERIAVALDDGSTAEECQKAAERHVYDMRREVIHDATWLLAQLKLGKTLRVKEMILLDGVVSFLKATVAPHQRSYPELSDEIISEWIVELGLRKKYPDYENYEILNDCALYPAIEEALLRRRIPDFFREPRKRPTVAQNKLAGRYVSKLALIANIAGPGKATPEEVVERFYRMQ